MDDAEKIHTELLKLRDLLKAPPRFAKAEGGSRAEGEVRPRTASADDKGFEYVIKSGDTLDAIVQAYKEKNIKVTVAQILKANPGLKAERLIVGKKIFIPAPQP
jgi:phage tail protein X